MRHRSAPDARGAGRRDDEAWGVRGTPYPRSLARTLGQRQNASYPVTSQGARSATCLLFGKSQAPSSRRVQRQERGGSAIKGRAQAGGAASWGGFGCMLESPCGRSERSRFQRVQQRGSGEEQMQSLYHAIRSRGNGPNCDAFPALIAAVHRAAATTHPRCRCGFRPGTTPKATSCHVFALGARIIGAQPRRGRRSTRHVRCVDDRVHPRVARMRHALPISCAANAAAIRRTSSRRVIWWPGSFCGRLRRAGLIAVPIPVEIGARRRAGRTRHGGGLPMRRNVPILPALVLALTVVRCVAGGRSEPAAAGPAEPCAGRGAGSEPTRPGPDRSPEARESARSLGARTAPTSSRWT